MMNFTSAIYALYPQVARIVGEDAFDADGNPVVYDRQIVEHHASLMALRANRNKLLAECDWVVTRAIERADDGFGLQLPQDWMQYRQALRDLPANTVDPANPVWPIKPGGN
jgi:Phage tail assembly chaperone protein